MFALLFALVACDEVQPRSAGPVVEVFEAYCGARYDVLSWDIHESAMFSVYEINPGLHAAMPYPSHMSIMEADDLDPGYHRLEVYCDSSFSVRVHIVSPG